jgi:hypothetical protein
LTGSALKMVLTITTINQYGYAFFSLSIPLITEVQIAARNDA